MVVAKRTYEKIFSHITEEEVVDCVRRLVRIPSTNPPGDYDEIIPLVAGMMQDIGLEVKLKGHRPGKENILGTLRGTTGRPSALFVTHIDTVPIGDMSSWTVDPFGGQVIDGKIYGRGACDQKGLTAAFLMAAKAVLDSGVKLKGDLLICCAVDEETGYINGSGNPSGVKYLEDIGFMKTVDMAVTSASFNWKIPLVGRGNVWLELTTFGEQSHPTGSSGRKPLNAISKMVDVLNKISNIDGWMTYTPNEFLGLKSGMWTDKPTFEPDVIQGGYKVNIVPDRCQVKLDMRILPGQKAETVVDELSAYLDILKKGDPELKVHLEPILLEDPGEVSEEDNPAIEAAKVATKILFNREAEFCGKSTPVGYYKDIPKSVIFGPERGSAHMPDEWMYVDEIVKASKAYAVMAAEMLDVET